MDVLKGLEPASVFRCFEELCGIPHGSGDTKRISDYCVRFAEARGLDVRQDEYNNVIIRKAGTPGYESAAPVMLQGHIDMVCEKEAGCDIDFSKDGLRLKLENGIVTAEGTTLGGDDGIAAAYMLAILDSDTIPHPPLECVFTVDEEIGMLGAAEMDMSDLQSRTMLNIDSEDEGFLLVSCAGGMTARCILPVERAGAGKAAGDVSGAENAGDADGAENAGAMAGTRAVVKVTGCMGGHSGTEIDKGRANASMVLGEVLEALKKEVPFCLITINGGLKDNAIPREAEAVIELAAGNGSSAADALEKISADRTSAQKKIAALSAEHQRRFAENDPGIRVEFLEETGINAASALEAACGAGVTGGAAAKEMPAPMTEESTDRVIRALRTLPNGVKKMSADIEGLVQTSLNLGIMKTEGDQVSFAFSVRSSVEEEKQALRKELEKVTTSLGGTVEVQGEYPAWEYRKDSPLRDLMVEVYTEQYGNAPVVQAIHAGVECGLFSGKLPGLDCVSFGPDMKDIHTPKESMDVESVRRTWNYLLEVLRRLK